MEWLEPPHQYSHCQRILASASLGEYLSGFRSEPATTTQQPAVEVDGSFGEGGGQILRTAVSFSIALGVPIHVTKIRAGRRVPGLRPQHAATIKILGDICSAKVVGARVGSTELSFSPGLVEASEQHYDLGTAASIPLVLQAVVPAVALAGGSLDLELVGGTDVPWSPTADYLVRVLEPAMKEMGIFFSCRFRRRGYYPVGGGRASVRIDPCKGVRPLQLGSPREEPGRVSVVSRCGGLPIGVAERQERAASALLRERGVEVGERLVTQEESLSQGTSVLVSEVGAGCFLGGDSIGARGKRAEVVGMEAAEAFVSALSSRARLDEHLADMVAPILCLSGSPSSLLVERVSDHLRTSLHVAEEFTKARSTISASGGAFLLSISPREQNS